MLSGRLIACLTQSAQKAITIGETVPLIDTNDLYPILERYEIKLL
jgi:hypothetical protein